MAWKSGTALTSKAQIERLITRLAEIPGLQPRGAATDFDVGGLRVVRPWAMAAPLPKLTHGDPRASDLWILQAKHRAIEMLGRDRDLQDLRDWLDGTPRISARLLVGRAGAGKTRLGFEFLWWLAREQSDRWQAGLLTGEALRRPHDWNAWTWDRPTVLLLDYAHALDEEIIALFRALARRVVDENLPPLRLLLLEREASATEGWFRRLLNEECSAGGGPVRDLFEPPEPVRLQPLDTATLRRAVLAATLAAASKYDGRPSPALPVPAHAPAFDRRLEAEIWSDPLYLMMAALVARDESLAVQTETAAGAHAFAASLSLGRADLAHKVAEHELRRLERFVPEGSGPSTRRLFQHLAACATLCGGLSGEQALVAARDEAAALGLVWPDGPGALAALLHEARADDRIQPGEEGLGFRFARRKVLKGMQHRGRHGPRTALRAAHDGVLLLPGAETATQNAQNEGLGHDIRLDGSHTAVRAREAVSQAGGAQRRCV